MRKIVVFSENPTQLVEARKQATQAGMAVQLRDQRAFTGTPDGQFNKAVIVLLPAKQKGLSPAAKKDMLARAARVQAAYEELDCLFVSSIKEAVDAVFEAPPATTVDPVDDPDAANVSGVGTVDDVITDKP